MSSPADGLFATVDERVRRAVEHIAATDAAPTDPFRGLYVADDTAVALAHVGPAPEVFEERLQWVGRRLGLSRLELAVLAFCAGPELGPHYGRLYGYLQDDITRRHATPRLAARLLTDPAGEAEVLACFDRTARLRRSGALILAADDPAVPVQERPVRLAGRLAGALLGVALQEPTAGDGLRRVEVPGPELGRQAVVERLARALEASTGLPVLVAGPDAPEVLAAAAGMPVLVGDAGELGLPEARADAVLRAALEGALLALGGLADADPERRTALARAVADLDRPVLCAESRADAVALGDRTAAVVEVPPPSYSERRAAWEALSGCTDVDDVAAKFRLATAGIAAASEVARVTARARGAAAPAPADLDEGARRASRAGLAELASRLDTAASWEDLVLPARQHDLLRSMCAYLRHRDRVLAEWGYARTISPDQGLKALFAGESGTGKTLAAQVLARELGLDLFRVDLATVVSKYVGETEKNLERIFSAAEGSNAILFFDEADALLGKRSDVGDAHDRYANIEVAYLLQRIERYPGGVVLATNFRQNIDDAFVRRIDVIVDFPFPEEDDRIRLWRKLLPDAAPVDDDVDLDFLARRFKLSGGAIRNCSVSAAFMAADDGGCIGMEHLVRAVALEYGKLGRLTLAADFERYHELVRAPAG